MKVVILGSGSYSGTPKPLCTCENCSRTRINPALRRTRFSLYFEGALIDPSPDLHYHLERLNKSVERVLITHGHFDHVSGLPELQVFKRVEFYSHKETLETAKSLARLAFGRESPENYEWSYHELEFWEEKRIGNMKVVHFPVVHTVKAGGFLIEVEGRKIAVTGDTGPEILMDERTLKLMEGADLLIAEMTHREAISGSHLGVREAIELARKVGADYTVFAHISHSNYPHEVLEKKVREAGISGEVARDFTWVEV
ncbi:MBL fold metallo-hydrolase [Thermococcus sp.]